MEAKEKAKELVNMYYTHAKTQAEAIQIVEGILLTTFCQRIDSLHGHIFFRNDFDDENIRQSIKELKHWQEVSYEVSQIKNKVAV